MSAEQIEITKQALAAVGRRDIAAMLELIGEDFELEPLVTVWQRSYVGRQGIAQWARDVEHVWDEFAIEADEFRQLDPETLLALVSWSGRARGGHATLDGPGAALIRFRGDLPVKASVFPDEASALRAAG